MANAAWWERPEPETTSSGEAAPQVGQAGQPGWRDPIDGSIEVVVDPPRVLIVADGDVELEQDLAAFGYLVEGDRSVEGAVRLAASRRFDALLVDLGIDGGRGIELVRQLRESGLRLPIVIISTRSDPALVVAGLDAGADDFVIRPIPVEILEAQIRALLRRWHRRAIAVEVGDVVLDLARLTVRRRGVEVRLGPVEACTLAVLMAHPGITLTTDQIARRIATPHLGSSSVEASIDAVRAKIDGPFGVELIETVDGSGHRLVGTPGGGHLRH